MKLTIQTDYALRTLMYLATCKSRAHISDVSSLFAISENHVAKVVNLLARYGFIRSVRGVGGGIELAHQPKDIILGEVIEKFEGNMHLLDCIDKDEICLIQSFCKLKTVLSEAERIQMEYLNGITLADVAPMRQRLSRLHSNN